MMSSLLHLVGLRPRVYYTLTNFRGGGARPPPQYANELNIGRSHNHESKGVNPCSNLGGIILGRNIHPACWMYCAKRRAYLGLFGGMLPRENFFKWCNLVHFGVYLDQILSLKNFKNYFFLYIKFCKLSFFYKNFKNYYFLYKK